MFNLIKTKKLLGVDQYKTGKVSKTLMIRSYWTSSSQVFGLHVL